jgi:peptidoglycan/LPS O-acetylase OafA/YrhL
VSAEEGGREPVLDGIRGIAIALVLVHHFVFYAGLARTATLDHYLGVLGDAAWIGVDVFFVLSGFLITGILHDTKEGPRFFRTFYLRRTLRIFPLYYGVLAATFLVAPAVLGRPLFGEASGNALWYWSYLSNVDVALHGWQQPLELGHFWSLAVEEQFYLLWPLAVFTFGRRSLLRIVAGCTVVALLLRVAAPPLLSPLSAYVLMPMRMDALGAGAFLALLVRGPAGWRVLGPWPKRVLAASLFMLGVLFLWRRGLSELDVVVRTAGYPVIAAATAALIAVAVAAERRTPLRRMLSSSLLVTLGKYSYGLYVFHHVVVLTLRERGFQAGLFPTLGGSELPGLVVFSAVAMTLSYASAWASWHLWETRFLRLKRFFEYGGPAGVTLPRAVPTGRP